MAGDINRAKAEREAPDEQSFQLKHSRNKVHRTYVLFIYVSCFIFTFSFLFIFLPAEER